MTRRQRNPLPDPGGHRAWADYYRREAGHEYGRARADARRAAAWYALAHSYRVHAAWLTCRPNLGGSTDFSLPAETESTARAFERMGDSCLNASFLATGRARDHAARARKYAGRQAELETRVAAYETERGRV